MISIKMQARKRIYYIYFQEIFMINRRRNGSISYICEATPRTRKYVIQPRHNSKSTAVTCTLPSVDLVLVVVVVVVPATHSTQETCEEIPARPCTHARTHTHFPFALVCVHRHTDPTRPLWCVPRALYSLTPPPVWCAPLEHTRNTH